MAGLPRAHSRAHRSWPNRQGTVLHKAALQAVASRMTERQIRELGQLFQVGCVGLLLERSGGLRWVALMCFNIGRTRPSTAEICQNSWHLTHCDRFGLFVLQSWFISAKPRPTWAEFGRRGRPRLAESGPHLVEIRTKSVEHAQACGRATS